MPPTEQLYLTFFNQYGLIFQDHFYLKYGFNFSKHSLDSIEKIKIEERRDLRLNALLLFCCIAIIAMCYFMARSIFFNICAAVLLFPFGIFSYYFKKFEYTILIYTKDYNFFKIPVEVQLKNDAVEMVKQVNKVKSKQINLSSAV